MADFGIARLAPQDPGATHISTEVKGTAGYLDPEYLMTEQLTEKSDVYSFGVLLVELITGRQPIDLKRPLNERITIKWVSKVMHASKAYTFHSESLFKYFYDNLKVYIYNLLGHSVILFLFNSRLSDVILSFLHSPRITYKLVILTVHVFQSTFNFKQIMHIVSIEVFKISYCLPLLFKL